MIAIANYVLYNGKTNYYHSCTRPTRLKKGMIYEIVGVDTVVDNGISYTEYTLRGIKGKFNSEWFDSVPVYYGYAEKEPIRGERFSCMITEMKDGKITGRKKTTRKVISYNYFGDSDGGNFVYMVFTLGAIYIITVL